MMGTSTAHSIDLTPKLYGRDRFRPMDRESARAAALELRRRGLTAHDISAALSISLGAVLDLIGERHITETTSK